ncbi:protein of unknown function DUF1217 [Methylobacterium sp. 4-46]|uniref:DUF1217 domain-containing protein n=1 Tax=unclassified Methylobacterium TaxID=2615210 RepID=UPI000152C33D|nr:MULTISPECIES: DUF1217 domain-containing protein [Methylobacterium]ACA20760.1 protein of unknown function DUF1217 [Methylobacterium sp. 4-46]WFT79911.1 DUF1217 domain-containing protein [Methylobacterium nodulans]
MTSTFTSYQLLTRDITKTLTRKANEKTVRRDTDYFTANIGKVKSVDDFMKDDRLYAYAMRAHGLEEMIYAKAFMRRVLTEGVASPSSFANRLADQRYVEFARQFQFATDVTAQGADPVMTGKTYADYRLGPAIPARLSGAFPLGQAMDFSDKVEARFTISSRVDATTTKSATIVLNKSTLRDAVSDLARVTPAELVAAINSQIAASGEANLAGKVSASLGAKGELFLETTAFASLGPDGKPGGTGAYADVLYEGGGQVRTITIQNLAPAEGRQLADVGFGSALPMSARAQRVTLAYLNQAIERDEGEKDTGVRLALYFTRMAPTLSSPYDILSDPALTKVANVVLGLPATSGAATSDALVRRAALIKQKIDIASFQDPAKVQAFVKRFAAIWDATNADAESSPVLGLFPTSPNSQAENLGRLQRSRAKF